MLRDVDGLTVGKPRLHLLSHHGGGCEAANELRPGLDMRARRHHVGGKGGGDVAGIASGDLRAAIDARQNVGTVCHAACSLRLSGC